MLALFCAIDFCCWLVNHFDGYKFHFFLAKLILDWMGLFSKDQGILFEFDK
jgi:hypothetical protein